MQISALIEKLIEAGTPAALVAEVAIELAKAEAATQLLESRRSKDRERKRATPPVPRNSTESSETPEFQEPPDKERFQTSKEINPIPPSPPTGAQTPTAKTRGSRLPDDFVPDLEVAISLGLDGERARLEADKFADHWRSAPGQRGVKLDWPATWRNWCRRALEQSGPGPPNGRGKQQTYFDLVREIDRNIQDADDNGQTHVYPAIPAKAH